MSVKILVNSKIRIKNVLGRTITEDRSPAHVNTESKAQILDLLPTPSLSLTTYRRTLEANTVTLFDLSLSLSLSHSCECSFLVRFIMGDSQYSFSLTTFSPSGKLVQIEHALTAVGSGQTSLGIKAANGVVIATEKKLPSILVDETSVQKIQLLTPNIGVVYSGMGPDFRVLVRKSRKQAEQYHRLYKEPIPVTQLVREVAAVMQEFTQSGGVRPFGVSLLVAGFDDNGPQLYQVDPSGSYFSWKASAMGKNVSNAKTFLEKRYTDDMELDDAVHTAILTLKEGFEGQISGKNIEIGIIGADKKFRVLTPAEIDDYLGEVE
ncbi:Proteasome subunit alpha type-2-A, partial [Mucuna pruriens]